VNTVAEAVLIIAIS